MSTIQCVSQVINKANSEASRKGFPVGICWNQAEGRWNTYDLSAGTAHEPEFVCYGQGRLPHPLTEVATRVFNSLIRSQLQV